MILALVVFCAMLPMDCAAAAKITLLDRRKPMLAGLCEVVNDWGGVLSYGVGGVALLRYGASFTTAVIFLALGAASVLGTTLGFHITNRAVADA